MNKNSVGKVLTHVILVEIISKHGRRAKAGTKYWLACPMLRCFHFKGRRLNEFESYAPVRSRGLTSTKHVEVTSRPINLLGLRKKEGYLSLRITYDSLETISLAVVL